MCSRRTTNRRPISASFCKRHTNGSKLSRRLFFCDYLVSLLLQSGPGTDLSMFYSNQTKIPFMCHNRQLAYYNRSIYLVSLVGYVYKIDHACGYVCNMSCMKPVTLIFGNLDPVQPCLHLVSPMTADCWMNNVVPASAGFDIGFLNQVTVGTPLFFSYLLSYLLDPLRIWNFRYTWAVIYFAWTPCYICGHPCIYLPNYVASIYLVTWMVPVRKSDL